MDRAQIGRRLYAAAHLTGDFILRSGQRATEYFDKYMFEADPKLLWDIAQVMKAQIPQGTEILAGLEMGGIPVVTALSLQSGLPAAFVRKRAKEYGTRKIAEGADLEGKRVCVIEDVVTTGGQILLSTKELRDRGAIVDEVLCVILRDPKAADILAEGGLTLHAAFTMEELKGWGEG